MKGEAPSPCEIQVWKLIAYGFSKEAIAKRLKKSENTVDRQVTSLYLKIGARSRADAARLAMAAGMIGSSNPPTNKRNGFDGKTHEHDMAILLAELELQKAKTRAAEARADRLEAENRDLLRRIPKAT